MSATELVGTKAILAYLEELGLARTDRTLRSWIRQKNFPAWRRLGDLVAPREDVRAWVRLQAVPAAVHRAA